MWRALKAELVYFRPWLLGGLAIAAGVVLLLSVLIRFAADADGPPGFVVAIFPVIAGMVDRSARAGSVAGNLLSKQAFEVTPPGSAGCTGREAPSAGQASGKQGKSAAGETSWQGG